MTSTVDERRMNPTKITIMKLKSPNICLIEQKQSPGGMTWICQRLLSTEDFMNRTTEATLQDAEHYVVRSDEIKIHLYRIDGKRKV